MNISSCTTALEPSQEPALASPTYPEHDLHLAVYCHTLSTTLQRLLNEVWQERSDTPDDIFEIGVLWRHIAHLYPDIQSICNQILARREQIKEQKEIFRKHIKCIGDSSLMQEVERALCDGSLIAAAEGIGASYFLYDVNSSPRFVVKPVDEDIFCLNNKKHFASFLDKKWMRFRDFIPLYRSAQTEMLAYLVACHMGMASITPKTTMMIIDTPSFYDISQSLQTVTSGCLDAVVASCQTEKLCSVQEYITNAVSMHGKVYQWLQEGKDEEQISAMLCQEDFEMANLFTWICYDTDAHLANFILYPKEGGIWGMKKVDNGLSFPEKNFQFHNFLTFFSIAKKPLSLEIKEKIRSIPKETIASLMQELHFCSESIDAFFSRVDTLQALADRENISCYEVNLRMMLIGKGCDGELSLEEIEESLGISTANAQERSHE